MANAVYGVINENGGIEQQSGGINTVSRLGKGNYQVKFNSGVFSSTPYVLATVMTNDNKCQSSGTNRTISLTNVSAQEVCVGIRQASAGNENSDRRFTFQAIEP